MMRLQQLPRYSYIAYQNTLCHIRLGKLEGRVEYIDQIEALGDLDIHDRVVSWRSKTCL